MPSRRAFLAAAAAAAVPAQIPATQPGWFDRPMRWAQLAFTEDDPGNYDPKFWLAYFKSIHADAACLSAGGCVAFYPTEVKYHYRSSFLGKTDPFGEMLKGCRELGMNVIARTDPHAMNADAFAAHPEWAAVEENGQPRKHWADPKLYVTCALGPYNFEFMTAVTKEIVTKYNVDGIFANRWTGSGTCYCASCQKLFARFSSGKAIPKGNQDKRQYAEWHQLRLFELWRLWDIEIKKINPQAAFIANSGGGATSELDMKTVGQLAPTLFADRQARRGLMAPWANGKNGKEYRATMGAKPIGGIFSIGVEEPYRWKDSVQHPAEIRVWVADGIAHGLRPWFTKFNAKPFDKRWLPVVEDIYNWHWRNEKYLRNTANLARTAIVYSQQSVHHQGAKLEDHALGFYQALVEARIPFEMVHDGLLDAASLKAFRTLILPNITALSEAQCAQLTAFVRNGGSIVATHETSLYNERGQKRQNFGLSALFGADYKGETADRVQNSYLFLERAHPLLEGLDETPRIIAGAKWVSARATDAFYQPPMTLIPSYPDLPMESVYPRMSHTTEPGVYLKQMDQSRVVYFPWDVDRTYWEVLAPDHLALLKNAVLWACNEPQPATVTGPGVIDVAVWRQKESIAVHLVNLTNPMMMKGPFREIIPIGAQTVEVQLPAGATPKAVKLLTASRPVEHTQNGRRLRVEVPSVAVHEVVAIDL